MPKKHSLSGCPLMKNTVFDKLSPPVFHRRAIIETFDENIWTALVETLTVSHDGSMVFLFKDGTEIKI